MSKFQLVYTSSNDEPEFIFDTEYPAVEITQNLTFSDDVSWQFIMYAFAAFLESTGYVGIRDKLDLAFDTLEGNLLPHQLFNTDPEDYTSNVGLDS
jgi:hypothetical protein